MTTFESCSKTYLGKMCCQNLSCMIQKGWTKLACAALCSTVSGTLQRCNFQSARCCAACLWASTSVSCASGHSAGCQTWEGISCHACMQVQSSCQGCFVGCQSSSKALWWHRFQGGTQRIPFQKLLHSDACSIEELLELAADLRRSTPVEQIKWEKKDKSFVTVVMLRHWNVHMNSVIYAALGRAIVTTSQKSAVLSHLHLTIWRQQAMRQHWNESRNWCQWPQG